MAGVKRLIDANVMRDDWLQNGENEYVYDANAVLESIDAQPTVDATEVVHAEWRIDGICTNCHYRAEVQSIGFNCTGGTRIEYKRTNFCPDCGAKMDGERRKVIETDLRTEG